LFEVENDLYIAYILYTIVCMCVCVYIYIRTIYRSF